MVVQRLARRARGFRSSDSRAPHVEPAGAAVLRQRGTCSPNLHASVPEVARRGAAERAAHVQVSLEQRQLLLQHVNAGAACGEPALEQRSARTCPAVCALELRGKRGCSGGGRRAGRPQLRPKQRCSHRGVLVRGAEHCPDATPRRVSSSAQARAALHKQLAQPVTHGRRRVAAQRQPRHQQGGCKNKAPLALVIEREPHAFRSGPHERHVEAPLPVRGGGLRQLRVSAHDVRAKRRWTGGASDETLCCAAALPRHLTAARYVRGDSR